MLLYPISKKQFDVLMKQHEDCNLVIKAINAKTHEQERIHQELEDLKNQVVSSLRIITANQFPAGIRNAVTKQMTNGSGSGNASFLYIDDGCLKKIKNALREEAKCVTKWNKIQGQNPKNKESFQKAEKKRREELEKDTDKKL